MRNSLRFFRILGWVGIWPIGTACPPATAADDPQMMQPDKSTPRGKSAVFPEMEMESGRTRPGTKPSTGPATAPSTGPATTQASTQPTVDPYIELTKLRERLRVSLVVKSVVIERVELRRSAPLPRGTRGINQTLSQDHLLVIKLEIHNECNIETLNIKDQGNTTPETSPSLEDATGQGFPGVTFGDFEPADALHKTDVVPGKMVRDIVVFAPPPGDVTPLHLRIPLKIAGRSMVLEADIDPKSIKR